MWTRMIVFAIKFVVRVNYNSEFEYQLSALRFLSSSTDNLKLSNNVRFMIDLDIIIVIDYLFIYCHFHVKSREAFQYSNLRVRTVASMQTSMMHRNE